MVNGGCDCDDDDGDRFFVVDGVDFSFWVYGGVSWFVCVSC